MIDEVIQKRTGAIASVADLLAKLNDKAAHMGSLDGKIAAITGAGSGIGKAIAARFDSEGARVFVLERDFVAGQRVVDGLKNSVCIQMDVSDEAAVRSAAEQLLAETGNRLDILVNNAGIGHVGTALTTTAADLERLHRVNVLGVLLVTQAFLPVMLQHRRGSVINLASIGGIVGIRDRLAYCANKFAVVGMTKCMALDHSTSGVRFNAICPGRVETPFVTARLQEYPDPEAARRQMAESQAIGRMGTPEEIAALFLARDDAAFVTGSALVIDGGFSAGK